MNRLLQNIVFASLWVSLSTTSLLNGQNIYKDYHRDRLSQYSPDDHLKRGSVYLKQTGHAGIFGNCDDDRAKMASPYIDWHCRKPVAFLPTFAVKNLFGDLFRKSDRLADGAGACLCGRCNSKTCDGDCEQSESSFDNAYASRNTSIVQKRNVRSYNQSSVNASQANRSNAYRGERFSYDSLSADSHEYRQQGQSTRQASNGGIYSASSNRLVSQPAESIRFESTRSQEFGETHPRSSQTMSAGDFQSTRSVGNSNVRSASQRFQLSAPSSTKSSAKSGNSNSSTSQVPAKGQTIDPRHFQFQLIGGSANR